MIKVNLPESSIAIIDNFLDFSIPFDSVSKISSTRDSSVSGKYNWVDKNALDSLDSYIQLLIKAIFSSCSFDSNKVIGLEYWSNNISTGDSMSYHSDIDEKLFKESQKLSYPIATIVYYSFVERLTGGSLVFENGVIIRPKLNRLVLFFGGVRHGVEGVKCGQRISVVVNVWDKIPLSYCDPIDDDVISTT